MESQKVQSGYISKKDDNGLGIGETITECNKTKYWFHSEKNHLLQKLLEQIQS